MFWQNADKMRGPIRDLGTAVGDEAVANGIARRGMAAQRVNVESLMFILVIGPLRSAGRSPGTTSLSLRAPH